MKLTRERLKQIIKEELEEIEGQTFKKSSPEQQSPVSNPSLVGSQAREELIRKVQQAAQNMQATKGTKDFQKAWEEFDNLYKQLKALQDAFASSLGV